MANATKSSLVFTRNLEEILRDTAREKCSKTLLLYQNESCAFCRARTFSSLLLEKIQVLMHVVIIQTLILLSEKQKRLHLVMSTLTNIAASSLLPMHWLWPSNYISYSVSGAYYPNELLSDYVFPLFHIFKASTYNILFFFVESLNCYYWSSLKIGKLSVTEPLLFSG